VIEAHAVVEAVPEQLQQQATTLSTFSTAFAHEDSAVIEAWVQNNDG
jgi:hypothetical protein